MDFYINSQDAVGDHLKKKYPIKEGENEDVYEKAIKARVFDSLRGFLPAGITTQLSWHTNLRQAWDKLSLMRHHPSKEMSQIAEEILNELKNKYPHSFSHELHKKQEDYREFIMSKHDYFNPKKHPKFKFETNINKNKLKEYKQIFSKRPEKTGLPYFLAELGNITFNFLLDYGSFRDVQRHRSGICRMPLLTTKFGFNVWYLNQLPKDLKSEAEKLIKEQITAVKKLKATPEEIQYYIALGFNVPCRMAYTLPAMTYVIELRSSKYVHPTLRMIAHKMMNSFEKMFPSIKLHCDLDPDDWDIRRGLQDIKEK